MIRTEAIRAWRAWRADADGLLESCLYGDAWEPRAPFTASCVRHARPAPECDCGVYAVTQREAAVELGSWAQSALEQPIVIGEVSLWGRVLPYSAGYRAEHAYPHALELLPDARYGLDRARELARKVRDRYLVDVLEPRWGQA
jgi:hypothetical protein